MRYCWFIILLTSLISCQTTITAFQTMDLDKIGIQSRKFRGTIFKKSYPQDKLFINLLEEVNRFTPTKEDILLAESILKNQIEKVNKSHINQRRKREYIEKNLKKYFRQYVGFINQKGERIIHINFYWNRFSINERTRGYWDDRLEYNSEYAVVFDGGSRYWNINVNLTTKNLYNLWVNGYA